jgi:prephenate dehydrogenase
MSSCYKHITIIGLGLMGGAFAKALSELKNTTLFGINRSEGAISFAKDKGWIKAGSTKITDIPSETDLVLLCGPTFTLPEVIKEVYEHVDDTTTIMDISSVKKGVIETFEFLKENETRSTYPTLLSCHPMVGSEKSGIENAHELEFLEKSCLMIEDYSNDDAEKLMIDIGFTCSTVKSAKHDELLAASSHFPYLMACLTSKALQDKALSTETVNAIIGSGFLDTTRISSSETGWGKDMCKDNKAELLTLLSNLKANIGELETAIETDSGLSDFLDSIQRFRATL